MRVFLTKTGVYERNDDDEKKTTDRRPQHPLPLVSCFLGLGQINPQSPFYSSISEETKAHDEHTRARSLTHTHHHIYIHTYIINK